MSRRRKIDVGNIGLDPANCNESFILRKSLEYLQSILEKHDLITDEVVDHAGWLLGKQRMDSLLKNIRKACKGKELEYILKESSEPENDAADIIKNSLRMFPAKVAGKTLEAIKGIIKQLLMQIGKSSESDIEQNIIQFAEFFILSAEETEFITFLYVINTHNKIRRFYEDELECGSLVGRKYLESALNLSGITLGNILNGKILKNEMVFINNSNLRLVDEYSEFIQNSGNNTNQERYFSIAAETSVPIENHFLKPEQTEHILSLLGKKPATSTNILIYGPPGTGKSSFARGIAKKLGIRSYEIAIGEDNLSKERRVALMSCIKMTNSGDGSIIIVDEADNILNTSGSFSSTGDTRDKGWLNCFLERQGTRIIWITNSIQHIEDSVMRRFAYAQFFPEFNEEQRKLLWKSIIVNNESDEFFSNNDIEVLSKRYKLNAGIIDTAVRKAKENGLNVKEDFLKTVELCLDSHICLRNGGKDQSRKDIIEPSYSTEGLNIKGDISIILEQSSLFDLHLRNNKDAHPLNMNFLFYGLPGTGKSELARYMTEHLGRNILVKKSSDILGSFVGQTEFNIKKAFEESECNNAVLVIDEIDSFLFTRKSDHHSWETSLINEFIAQMERFRGILIGTTNRYEALDPASIRRFHHKVGFDFLLPEGNVVFYNRLLQPLLGSTLSEEERESLKGIANLAPGDFKSVRDRFCFYPKDKITNTSLIYTLKVESQLKDKNIGKKKIGFV